MSTVIGSVTLNEDMSWSDEFQRPLVNSSAEPTIGGGVYVQEFARTESGRPITLESTESGGLQKKSTLTALKALADVPLATYTLTISSNSQTVTKTVRFRNEMSEGPIDFAPVQARDGLHGDDVWYRGKISLMVV